jgi:uncharacterized UBP type Zn finger protein
LSLDSIDINGLKNKNLEEYFNNIFSNFEIEKTCLICQKSQTHLITTKIYEFPKILILHLKRYKTKFKNGIYKGIIKKKDIIKIPKTINIQNNLIYDFENFKINNDTEINQKNSLIKSLFNKQSNYNNKNEKDIEKNMNIINIDEDKNNFIFDIDEEYKDDFIYNFEKSNNLIINSQLSLPKYSLKSIISHLGDQNSGHFSNL